MLQTNQHTFKLNLILDECRKLTDLLNGQIATTSLFSPTSRSQTPNLIGVGNDLSVTQDLYASIKAKSPEADHSYWLSRTWDLLCWQPIYISFISIYSLNLLPAIHSIRQQTNPALVAGFWLDNSPIIQDEAETLIPLAAEQLSTLFESYQSSLQQWTRCRPGFTRRLVSDLIHICLVTVKQLHPNICADSLYSHAKLWLKGLSYPTQWADDLIINSDRTLSFTRSSCCFVYKTTQGKLCSNCPKRKLQNNKKKVSTL